MVWMVKLFTILWTQTSEPQPNRLQEVLSAIMTMETLQKDCNNGGRPVNCQGSWDGWSECNAPCGGVLLSFTIETPSSNGGTECSFEVVALVTNL